MASPSKLTIAKWTVAIGIAFVGFAAIAFLTGRVASSNTSYDDDEAAKRVITLQKLRADETLTLTTADWIDKTKQIIRLPINDALPHTLDMLKAKPMQSSEEIPSAVPIPAPAPTPSPAVNVPVTPAPAPAPQSSTSPTPETSVKPVKATPTKSHKQP